MIRADSEKEVQRSLLVTLSLYRQEPEGPQEGTLSVPCYMMAASGSLPLTPDLGVLLVPHLEDPGICSHSLGFMGWEEGEKDFS